MPALEGVQHVVDREFHRHALVRHHGPGLLKAVAKAGPERLAAHQGLLAAGVALALFHVHVVRVDVDQLDHEIGVAAAAADKQVGLHRAGQRQVAAEHLALVDQHVRPARRKALVRRHVLAAPALGNFGGVGHRLGRVADVFVKQRLGCLRRLETEPPVGLEVQGRRARLFRWPAVETAPAVGPGLEHPGLGQFLLVAALQVLPEEAQLDRLVDLGGIEAEVRVADLAALGAGPAAVGPGADHQGVADARVLPLDCLVGLQRAVQVLGVVPAAHREHRSLDVLQVRQQVSALPVAVVVRMLREFVPVGNFVLEVLRVDVGQTAQVEKELVGVGHAVLERRLLGIVGRRRPGLAEAAEETEGQLQVEGAVAVHVVAAEPVGDRRLRRHRLECRVRVDGAGRGIEARVGDAPLADPAVVERNMAQQPLDAVEGVAALVDVLRPVLERLVRPHVYEFAFRHVAAAHVLKNEDEALFLVLGAGCEHGLVLVGTVGSHRIGGALQQHRIGPGRAGLHRGVDRGEQQLAVARRNPVLELAVVLADVVGALFGALGPVPLGPVFGRHRARAALGGARNRRGRTGLRRPGLGAEQRAQHEQDGARAAAQQGSPGGRAWRRAGTQAGAAHQ